MNSEEFKQTLHTRRENVNFNGVTSYQHIERMGSEEVEGLLDGPVIVQNKIDGANVTIAYGEDGHLFIAYRNNIVYHALKGRATDNFGDAIKWVMESNVPLLLANYPDWILRGEWLVKHTINYSKEVMNQVWVFDVQRKDDFSYVHIDEYAPILCEHKVPYLAAVAIRDDMTIDDLVKLVDGPDGFGAAQKEGIVVKRYDFVNKYGRTTWGKLIAADFQVKHKLSMGTNSTDPLEMAFAASLEDSDIEKIVSGVAFLHEEAPKIQHMSEVLGRAWHDAIRENLWDFLKSRRVELFNFKTARGLVEKRVREYALAYYNGTLKRV